MKLLKSILGLLFFCFIILFSCEKDDDVKREQALEHITFTINNDYTYTIEILENTNNDCDFLVGFSDSIFINNSLCEEHDNSELYLNINNIGNVDVIPITLHGSFGGLETEAVLHFLIPYFDSAGNEDLRIFQMLNGNVNIINIGEVGEYIDFEFSGEALLVGSSAEVVSVIGTANILRDE